MPTCLACGLDVSTEGFCAECKTEKKKTQVKKKKTQTIEILNIQSLILMVSGYILVGLIGFLLGYIVFGKVFNIQSQQYSTSIPRNSQQVGKTKYLSPISDDDVIRYDITKRSSIVMENKDEYLQYMIQNTYEKEEFIDWRWECVEDLLSWKSIKNDRVKEAFLRAPRENFIRKRNLNRAYEHAYMPIGYGATITDPWIVSVMTQTIDPQPHHKVLEIGTGSGYQSSLLSQLTNHVFTIEVIDELAKETHNLYKTLELEYPEYKNIHRVVGDGYYGWPEKSPFDRIIVTCSIDHIPPPLLKQMAPDGIMVIPVGPPSGQKLLKVTKFVEGDSVYFDRENLLSRKVRFIAFRDSQGKSYSATSEDE